MNERYLFLDIDGVLNHHAWDGMPEPPNLAAGVDPELVRRLCDWLGARPDLRVVLSSAWRHYWSKEEIAASFRTLDARFPDFYAETVDWPRAGRDVEILFFLRGRILKNPGVCAVVLDDWPFPTSKLIAPILVKTRAKYGLSLGDLAAADLILQTPPVVDWEAFSDKMKGDYRA